MDKNTYLLKKCEEKAILSNGTIINQAVDFHVINYQ